MQFPSTGVAARGGTQIQANAAKSIGLLFHVTVCCLLNKLRFARNGNILVDLNGLVAALHYLNELAICVGIRPCLGERRGKPLSSGHTQCVTRSPRLLKPRWPWHRAQKNWPSTACISAPFGFTSEAASTSRSLSALLRRRSFSLCIFKGPCPL